MIQLPHGPFVTATVLMSLGAILATATVASPFTTGVELSYSTSIPTSTATDAPKKDTKLKSDLAAIIVGIVFGTLVVLLIVLSVLLWRAKRKRAHNRGSLLPSEADAVEIDVNPVAPTADGNAGIGAT
ncbi:hypothetical protein BCR34DRAFT_606755 [Clohesyomyces aquaticus]|uniref:Mid2 domain-containing protein n=1 Tax=Clohesyomyces aquaticus TaxID=1231657 RepID=A0A1Y1YLQ4_9PLEO|nr:hypothetical protein BCR34DRAFT_606755 [Clohesyomyces aquaticus]